MSKEEIIAHRCAESLKRGISVRYCNPYKMIDCVPEWGYTRWWLLKHEHDFDYDSHYLQPIAPVEFCPFCGRNLTI